MELVHLDFLTWGGKADDSRSVDILIVTGYFMKYAQAYVTPKKQQWWLLEPSGEFLVHYGWPEKSLTDQGKSFLEQLNQRIV